MTPELIEQFIIGLDTRLKRLEENIGSATDTVLRFLAVKEEIGTKDIAYIYKRNMNNSFMLGTSKMGIDTIGDRRGAEVLLWSGG